MKERFLLRRVLDPTKVTEYVKWHKNVPEGLMDIYRKVGVTDLSCFLCENDLVVFMEVDREIYQQHRHELASDPIDTQWQSLMATLNEPNYNPLEYNEVFRM